MYPQIEKLLSKKFNKAMARKDEENRVTVETEVRKWESINASVVQKTLREENFKLRISNEHQMKDIFQEHFDNMFKKIEGPLEEKMADFFYNYMSCPKAG